MLAHNNSLIPCLRWAGMGYRAEVRSVEAAAHSVAVDLPPETLTCISAGAARNMQSLAHTGAPFARGRIGSCPLQKLAYLWDN
jgi:hypothetical protein